MSASILSGTEAADALLKALHADIAALDPKLVVVQVGDDPASTSYIRQKMRSCERAGLRAEHRHLPESTAKEELFACIDELNRDDRVTGFIVQLPLPEHLQPLVPQITRAMDPAKDLDGFTAYNLGKTFLSREFEHLPPATPAGIILLLEHYGISPEGKHAVIVGRSNTVGKPLAIMLLNRNATVTVCHSKTHNLAGITKQADILVAAVGRPRLITKPMVKEGSVVIDVGINREGGKLVGDVDFQAVQAIASAMTPVPGGVGPMTVASLIRNCVMAAKRQRSRPQ